MECKRFKLSISDYLDDRLDGDDRLAFRKHLQSCALCRAEAFASDPSLMFVFSGSLETDEKAVSDCADAVSALIRQERLRNRLAPRSRRWLAAAAACVVVVGGGLLWNTSPWSVDAPPVAVNVPAPEVTTEEAVPPPRVEVEMPDSAVRLYQFAGSDDESTAVYFVVNEAMEL